MKEKIISIGIKAHKCYLNLIEYYAINIKTNLRFT